MAISKMAKVMVVSHRSEVKELLELLQQQGILEILNAERAMVTKEWPELTFASEKLPKELADVVADLNKSMAFLEKHSDVKKGITAALAPRAVVEDKMYSQIVSGHEVVEILNQAQACQATIEDLEKQRENTRGNLDDLLPWSQLTDPLEHLQDFNKAACFAGLIPSRNLEDIENQLTQLGAAMEIVGTTGRQKACVVLCLNEASAEVQKLLRASDFDAVSFAGLTGTAAQLIAQRKTSLQNIEDRLADEKQKAALLAKDLAKLGMLFDHYQNLTIRENTRSQTPATEHVVLMEGWVRSRDYEKLEKIVKNFKASNVAMIAPAPGEDIPVEIENNWLNRPFEVVTRLYGMPQYFEVDPTAIMAPFFALFFALCLTDAGYGLIIIAFCAYMIYKMQGDKKLMWLLLISGILTVGTGAMTGGWFGDAPQRLASIFGWNWLNRARESVLWFDPIEEPMKFFVLSLYLGYLHIMVGLLTAFIRNLSRKDWIAALCDQLTWLVMINCITLYMFGAKFGLSEQTRDIFSKIAMVPAAMIVLFSQRQGGWGGRIGMGCYQLFSTIFYMGDLLSYLRLMALGMVTGGLAMAFNVLADLTTGVPYVGFILMIVVLIVGHLFNTAISGLGAFVHTIRLQFVEFFPKFLVGGGRHFEPLRKEYKHTYITKSL